MYMTSLDIILNSYILFLRNRASMTDILWSGTPLNNITMTDSFRFLNNRNEYHFKISNIRRTKSQNLNASGLGLQLSLCSILKPGVKSRMKM